MTNFGVYASKNYLVEVTLLYCFYTGGARGDKNKLSWIPDEADI